MPPYFRFPETENIQQQFWARGALLRRPLCGLVSIETGTKIFIWGNILCSSFWAFSCGVLLVLPMFLQLHVNPSHEELISEKDKENVTSNATETIKWDDEDEFIDKIYLKQPLIVLQASFFWIFVISVYMLFTCSKLKKGVAERDAPKLKKYFFIAVCLFILGYVPYFVESEVIWSRAFLFEVPILILNAIGFMFIHAFIVSLENPASNQPDDLNRIQFNP